MAEGELKPDIGVEDVVRCLRSKFDSDDFQLKSWKLVSSMEDGKLGFLGDHYRVKGSVQHPADAEPRDFSFFVKALPANPVQRRLVEASGAFRKESLFYELLARDFVKLVPVKRGPDFQPFLYPVCHIIKKDCLILDDLGSLYTPPRTVDGVLDLEHCEMVITDIARFHAASIVLEERKGKRLSELYPELMFETFFSGDPAHYNSKWHKASVKFAQDIVPYLDRYNKNPELVRRIQDAIPGLLAELFPALLPWPGTRNVMVHGDLWINNLMYRYRDGHPVEVSLVDYQLLRYTPPAHDLVMFVLFCTDQAFQDAHFGHLTRLHWDRLAAVLREEGCDPDVILPWSEFNESVKKMWKIGLIQMSMEHPIALCPSDIIEPILNDPVQYNHHFNVDRSETLIKVFCDERLPFKRRMTETMTRLIDGYILNTAGEAGDE